MRLEHLLRDTVNQTLPIKFAKIRGKGRTAEVTKWRHALACAMFLEGGFPVTEIASVISVANSNVYRALEAHPTNIQLVSYKLCYQQCVTVIENLIQL
jgi:hypothetical protein